MLPVKFPEAVCIMFGHVDLGGIWFEVNVACLLERTFDSVYGVTASWAEHFNMWRTPVCNKKISLLVEIHSVWASHVCAWKFFHTNKKQWHFCRLLIMKASSFGNYRHLVSFPIVVCFPLFLGLLCRTPKVSSLAFLQQLGTWAGRHSCAAQQYHSETVFRCQLLWSFCRAWGSKGIQRLPGRQKYTQTKKTWKWQNTKQWTS